VVSTLIDAPAVVAAFVEVALVPALPVAGLLDDPQPAASTSRQQAIVAVRGLFIGRDPIAPTLADSMTPRHFLTGAELSAAELDALLDRALELKRAPLSSRALTGRSVALIFEKPSTRTRVSFEVGIDELGGHAVVLRSDELQLSRGEAVRDTALVLSRHVAAVGLRTGPDELLEELAARPEVLQPGRERRARAHNAHRRVVEGMMELARRGDAH